MRQMITILATASLASSLLTAAAEARGGGSAVGGFGRVGARIGSDRVHFDGAKRHFDSSNPVFERPVAVNFAATQHAASEDAA